MADYYTFYQLVEPGGSPASTSKIDTTINRYTSADDDADNAAGETFTAVTMSRGVIIESGKLSDASLAINFTSTNEFAKDLMLRQVSNRWWVDISTSPDATPFWRGVFKDVKPQRNQIIMTFVNAMAALDVYGTPWIAQKTCRFRLFDEATCEASTTGATISYTIEQIDALKSQVLVLPAPNSTIPVGTNWLRGATLHQGGRTYTIYSSGDGHGHFLNLSHTSNLQKGAATITQGCDKTLKTCDSLYNNKSNFGGFPDLPPSKVWGEDIVRVGALE